MPSALALWRGVCKGNFNGETFFFCLWKAMPFFFFFAHLTCDTECSWLDTTSELPAPLSSTRTHAASVGFLLLRRRFHTAGAQRQRGLSSVSLAVVRLWLVSGAGIFTESFSSPHGRRKAGGCVLCQQCLCNYWLCQIGPAELTLSTRSRCTVSL